MTDSPLASSKLYTDIRKILPRVRPVVSIAYCPSRRPDTTSCSKLRANSTLRESIRMGLSTRHAPITSRFPKKPLTQTTCPEFWCQTCCSMRALPEARGCGLSRVCGWSSDRFRQTSTSHIRSQWIANGPTSMKWTQ